MTYEQFLDALAKTPRTWWLRPGYHGEERLRNLEDCCPIEAVGKGMPKTLLSSVIMITDDIPGVRWANEVISAADGSTRDLHLRMMAQMKVACGLTLVEKTDD